MYVRFQEPGARNERHSKNKLSRNKSDLKGTTPEAGVRKPAVSHSLSFPAKGIRANSMKKSVDKILIKTDSQHVRGGSIPSVSSGPVSRCVPSQSNSRESNLNGSKSSLSQASVAASTSFQRNPVRQFYHRMD